MENKRNKWIALGLTILTPGLGHVYCGQIVKGIILSLLYIMFPIYYWINILYIANGFFLTFLPIFFFFAVIVYAYITSYKLAQSEKEYTKKSFNRIYFYILYPIFFLLLSVLTSSVTTSYNTPAASMENTIMIGDYISCDNLSYIFSKPQINDLVVFIVPTDNTTLYLKRIVALPNDTILIKDKKVYINSIELQLPEHSQFIDLMPDGTPKIIPRKPGGRMSRDNYGPYVVPTDSYFMMGDNRDNSYDSRYWGAVPRENILGKGIIIYWSDDFSRIGTRLD